MREHWAEETEQDQMERDRVVIAAAIAALSSQPALVRRIRSAPGHGRGAWTREGRLGIQTAHQMPAALIRMGPDRGVEDK
jgi:hypothetical protein